MIIDPQRTPPAPALRTISAESVLRAYERWEADVILCPQVWQHSDGLPHLTQPLWDRLIEIQAERNAVLAGARA